MNPNMTNPNPQFQQQNFNPYQTLPFVLVQDMTMTNSYNIGPYEQEVVHAGIRMIEQNR